MDINIKDLIQIIQGTDTFIFNSKLSQSITEKGPADYVTMVDTSVQQYLYDKLTATYPTIEFMGEEQDNSKLNFKKDTWIIDPIDGTTNLVHDCKFSAVSIGLWNGAKQKITLGVVYQPFSKDIFYAIENEGAFLNDEPIHVTTQSSFKDSLIAIGTSPYYKSNVDEVWATTKDIFLNCSDIRRGGTASLDIAYVACGRLDGFVEKILSPWDYAAGIIILQEAGGIITDYNGNLPSGTHKSSICCSNKLLHSELLNIVQRNVIK